MKYLAGFLAGLAASMPLALGAQSTGFDDMAAGTAPAGWILTVTGKGSPRWMVMTQLEGCAGVGNHALDGSGVCATFIDADLIGQAVQANGAR